jgi:hypothetical protein
VSGNHCSHCPGEADAIVAGAVVVVAVAEVWAVRVAIFDALVVLLVVAVAVCAAGAARIVVVLRRTRGAVTTAAQMAALPTASRRAVPARRQAAISAARQNPLIGIVINDREVQRQEVRR